MRGPPSSALRRQRDERSRPIGPVPATDVAIIGGGVIGLAVGWQLLRSGFTVAIFERESTGSGASLAATGMLAAAAEFEPGGEALLELALESQRLWPNFAAELAADSHIAIDHRKDGVLLVALSRDEIDRLRFRYKLQQQAGLATQWQDAIACRELEPGLRPSVAAGILCPGDHQVDPVGVMSALKQAVLRRGGHLFENCSAELWQESGQVVGVETDLGSARATVVVAAAGAWTGQFGLPFPIRPLKGQSLALKGSGTRPLLERMVWTEQVHLAPKSDGTIIVGATVEESGFDDAVTAGGAYALLEGGRRALPGIEDLPLDAIWSGFRPTTIDDAPILGETSIRNLIVAAGHHRNGYLLAPVTASAIVQLVQRGKMIGPAEAFSLNRFTQPEIAR
jgi:glycine oxidase